jgi:hypothetical protein
MRRSPRQFAALQFLFYPLPATKHLNSFRSYFAAALFAFLFSASAATKPNILFIYADDLDYGDTSAFVVYAPPLLCSL